jgi:hypothetical protein
METISTPGDLNGQVEPVDPKSVVFILFHSGFVQRTHVSLASRESTDLDTQKNGALAVVYSNNTLAGIPGKYKFCSG